jgi:2-C-methyl-D-erythritol 2,4-cyclodiphosphate synthase
MWKNADSRDLLRRALATVEAAGWRPVNVDTTVVCETPKIGPHAAAIRASVAAVLGIALDAVNVKGKTSEGMGFTGTGEGMAVYAVALLRRFPTEG